MGRKEETPPQRPGILSRDPSSDPRVRELFHKGTQMRPTARDVKRLRGGEEFSLDPHTLLTKEANQEASALGTYLLEKMMQRFGDTIYRDASGEPRVEFRAPKDDSDLDVRTAFARSPVLGLVGLRRSFLDLMRPYINEWQTSLQAEVSKGQSSHEIRCYQRLASLLKNIPAGATAGTVAQFLIQGSGTASSTSWDILQAHTPCA